MSALSPFAERCVFALTPLGPVRARRMFGGYGIFMDDLMFALIAGDTLYLKVDADTRPRMLAEGGQVFSYRRGARNVEMSYVSAPESAGLDMAKLGPWAEMALAAARAARGNKAKAKAERR